MRNKLDKLDELATVITAFVLILMLAALWGSVKDDLKLMYQLHVEEVNNDGQ